MNKIIITKNKNPYHNLALEEYLAQNCTSPVLYLWQNEKTVVIGYAQNAYAECKSEKIIESGGFLARRTTGGGAVYHDLGNLNFTFIMPNEFYDVKKQFQVIKEALKQLNIDAEISGRNDILIEGKKFSGNAFKHTKKTSIHHGTIMVNVDTSKLGEFLTVSKAKIEAKGIKSVRSRVINLCELKNDITVEKLIEVLKNSFIKNYGECEVINEEINDPQISILTDKFASKEWVFGNNPSCNVSFKKRFDFGEIEFNFRVIKGLIQECVIYSDILNTEIITSLTEAFKNIPYRKNTLLEAADKVITDSPEKIDNIKDFIASIMS